MDFQVVNYKITQFIKEYVDSSRLQGLVVGLSGGIDSTVVAFAACQAIGNNKILGLLMPDIPSTTQQDMDDALSICSILGIEHKLIGLNDIKEQFHKALEPTNNLLVTGNLSARIRMCIVYYYSALKNHLVAGTSNKTELSLGYFTKYGDGASDILPIGGLYKTEVKEYAKFLNVPQNIVEKKSSARLWENQITEDEIGLSFEQIDGILKFLDNTSNMSTDLTDLTCLYHQFPTIPDYKIKNLLSLIKKNKHKLYFPPICRIN
ncbi:MAG: NAD+ synthase [Thermoproteota archaeon]|nr:NAD+ synthase [Thermoproteota archaeon]